MQEKNQHRLAEGLRQLPDYDPPAMVWHRIDKVLLTDEKLAQLPQYAPPAMVWENIELELSNNEEIGDKPVGAEKKDTTIRLFFVKNIGKMAAVAATVSAIFWGLWLVQLSSDSTIVGKVSVTQEVVDNQILAINFEQEDEAFQMVENLCKNPLPVCQNPVFKDLKQELDELTKDKTKLKKALGQYNDDTEMLAQMVRIEKERTEVLSRIMQML